MTEEQKSVCQRFLSCFTNPQFVLSRFRGLMIGLTVYFSIVEITLHVLVKQSVQVGELPAHTGNIAIIIVSVVEVLLGPFVSWLGYSQRRNVIILWMLITAVTVALLWALPDIDTRVPKGEGLCEMRDVKLKGITVTSIIRIIMILVVGCVNCLAKLAVFSHVIAYMAEHNVKKFSVQIGIFIYYRLTFLVYGQVLVKDTVENKLWLQVLMCFIPMLTNIAQMFMNPRIAPEAIAMLKGSPTERGFLVSTGRVFSNKLVMSQIFAMTFLIGAFFGFAYHSNDILKSQYYIVESTTGSMIFATMIRYKFVYFGLMYYGLLQCEPIRVIFDKTKAVKTATFMSVLAIITYVAMALLNCEKGNLAGLTSQRYIQPQCSLSCDCVQPWTEFSPVCLVDDMTTYLSPCHAGCTLSEDVNGIKFLNNCTCTETNGRAIYGACSDRNCVGVYELYKVLFLALVFSTMVAIQAQYTTVLRCCEPRDRSLSFGVATAVVSLIAFICVHVIYVGISLHTCAWSEGGICHMQNSTFSKAVGFTSAGLVVISLIISIITIVKQKKNQAEEIHRIRTESE